MDATTSWETFFQMMILEEHGAQKKYEMMAQLANSPELKKLFTRFAQEETMHAQLLESELMKLEKKGV